MIGTKLKHDFCGLMLHWMSKREINNSKHLCFPFMTLTLNNLLNFSINLIDDNNKEIEFASNEKKKVSILNVKIDVFLR